MREERLREALRRVESQVGSPDFAELARRGRRRRMQRGVGGVAAVAAVTAVVVGGIASVSNNLAGDPPPVPATEAPSPPPTSAPTQEPPESAEPTAEEIVDSPGATLHDFAMDAQGRQLAVWRQCDARRCPLAWAWSDDGWESRTVGQVPARWPEVYPLSSGFIVKDDQVIGFLVDSEGRRHALELGDPPLPIGPGHVVVEHSFDFTVVDPQTLNQWTLLPPEDHLEYGDAVIDPEGGIWGQVFPSPPPWRGVVHLMWSTDFGRTWAKHLLDRGPTVSPGLIAVSGDRVAAFSTFDGATLAPVGTILVSTDGGASWSVLDRSDVPFKDISAFVSTSSGRLFVSNSRGRLWRSSDGSWTRFEPANGPRTASFNELAASGDAIYAPDVDQRSVHISTDDGETWEEVGPH